MVVFLFLAASFSLRSFTYQSEISKSLLGEKQLILHSKIKHTIQTESNRAAALNTVLVCVRKSTE